MTGQRAPINQRENYMAEIPEVAETSDRTLNRMVGATVVVLSVLLTIGNIKDGNIVQNMQGDQASKIDLWNEYQATKIKAHLSEDTASMLGAMGQSPESAAATKTAVRYRSESKGLQDQAKAAEADYDVQGRRDDQFDLAEGFMSIALAVSGISALTESRRLLMIGWAAAGLGLLFLVSGFLELPIHPDVLVAFLT
ncbi:MAG: hypothetical protein JWL66_2898 [Sphingomonadales bacterium]|nr:hypothetical protein [Sphingomonadales bacterium]